MPPTDDIDDLRRQLAHVDAVIAELRGVVADLRKQVEAQQAPTHRLVKITFGRGDERVEGPTLAAFADWLDGQHCSATPTSLFGQAVGYARNQLAWLVRYLNDARFDIDNGATERAIRPLAIGRATWLHVGGDGGLKTASVLLSVCASGTRHRLNPWAYLTHVLSELPTRSAVADLSDLLPDAPTQVRCQLAA